MQSTATYAYMLLSSVTAIVPLLVKQSWYNFQWNYQLWLFHFFFKYKAFYEYRDDNTWILYGHVQVYMTIHSLTLKATHGERLSVRHVIRKQFIFKYRYADKCQKNEIHSFNIWDAASKSCASTQTNSRHSLGWQRSKATSGRQKRLSSDCRDLMAV